MNLVAGNGQLSGKACDVEGRQVLWKITWRIQKDSEVARTCCFDPACNLPHVEPVEFHICLGSQYQLSPACLPL